MAAKPDELTHLLTAYHALKKLDRESQVRALWYLADRLEAEDQQGRISNASHED